MVSLHNGQISFFSTHPFKQSTWKICLEEQLSSAICLSGVSLKSSKQIEQASPASFSASNPLALLSMKALTPGSF